MRLVLCGTHTTQTPQKSTPRPLPPGCGRAVRPIVLGPGWSPQTSPCPLHRRSALHLLHQPVTTLKLLGHIYLRRLDLTSLTIKMPWYCKLSIILTARRAAPGPPAIWHTVHARVPRGARLPKWHNLLPIAPFANARVRHPRSTLPARANLLFCNHTTNTYAQFSSVAVPSGCACTGGCALCGVLPNAHFGCACQGF